MLYLLPILALIASPLGVAAALDKPTIEPPISPDGGLGALNNPLFGKGGDNIDNYDPAGAALSAASYTVYQLPSDTMPKWTRDEAIKNKLSVHDFTCYQVVTGDCDTPWNMCVHKDSPLSIEYIVKNFVRLPVGMRDYVNNIMVQPGGRSAYTYGDNIVITGDCHGTELVHEVGHNLDAHAYPGGQFSDSQTWLDAYNADKVVPDSYAQSSQAENHSQFVVIALYDVNVEGGIPAVEPNSGDFYQQYMAVRNNLGDILKHGGTCKRFFENDQMVDINQKRSRVPSSASNFASRGNDEIVESKVVAGPWKTVWDKSA